MCVNFASYCVNVMVFVTLSSTDVSYCEMKCEKGDERGVQWEAYFRVRLVSGTRGRQNRQMLTRYISNSKQVMRTTFYIVKFRNGVEGREGV